MTKKTEYNKKVGDSEIHDFLKKGASRSFGLSIFLEQKRSGSIPQHVRVFGVMGA